MSGAAEALPRGPDDPTFTPTAYRFLTRLLRGGLVLSLVFLEGADVAYVAAHPNQTLSGLFATSEVRILLSPVGLAQGLASGDAAAFLLVGIFLLIATPLARVFTGYVYFHRGRETALATLTFTVFVLLLVGLFVVGPLVS